MLLLILIVPGALASLAGLLAVTHVFESRILCPRSLIVSAARARGSTPEYAEAFVAAEIEKLLASAGVPEAERRDRASADARAAAA